MEASLLPHHMMMVGRRTQCDCHCKLRRFLSSVSCSAHRRTLHLTQTSLKRLMVRCRRTSAITTAAKQTWRASSSQSPTQRPERTMMRPPQHVEAARASSTVQQHSWRTTTRSRSGRKHLTTDRQRKRSRRRRMHALSLMHLSQRLVVPQVTRGGERCVGVAAHTSLCSLLFTVPERRQPKEPRRRLEAKVAEAMMTMPGKRRVQQVQRQ